MKCKNKITLFIFLVLIIINLKLKINNKNLMTFKINYKSNSAKIAVLDSGYEQNNDENIKIVKIFDYDDGIDRYGHGKKVIDIINKSNKSAQIYSIKVLDDVGKGNRKRILKALDWCYYNNIELINISFSM